MKQAVVRSTCDRCSSLIKENPGDGWIEKDVEDDPQIRVTGSILAKVKGVDPTAPISFEDLCEKCESRVVSLLVELMKTGKGKRKKPAAKPKNNNKKKTPKTGTGDRSNPDFSDVPPA